MIYKDNKFKEIKRDFFIEKILLSKNKKGIEKEIKLINNSLGKNIFFQDLITSNVNGINQSLIYIKSNLKIEKNINNVSKVIFSCFKSNPFIFEFSKTDYSYYLINSSFLENIDLDQTLEKITKKKSFILIKIEYNKFNDLLKYENLNNNSVLDMFDDMVYKIIFLYILKINRPFKKHIKYETMHKYNEIEKINKKINNLIKGCKKIYNNQKLIEVNKQIQELKVLSVQYLKEFENEYNNIKFDF